MHEYKDRREEKRRKARHGMRIRGRSINILWEQILKKAKGAK